MRQMTLAYQAEFQCYSKETRREQFLEVMEAVMPWAALPALVGPYCPKGEMGGEGPIQSIASGDLVSSFAPSDDQLSPALIRVGGGLSSTRQLLVDQQPSMAHAALVRLVPGSWPKSQ